MVYVGDHAGINEVIDDVKQVDILISKNQALQILYHVYNHYL